MGPLPTDVGDALPRHHLHRARRSHLGRRLGLVRQHLQRRAPGDGPGPGQELVPAGLRLAVQQFLCGDGAIQEHPRGSLCQIAPVVDPDKDHYKYYPAVEIDLEDLIKQLGPPPLVVNTLDDLAIESAQESLLLEPPGLGRE
ncbi:MAG: hypothetical protein QOC62_6032 [Mycobacterium sp.]|nr:hypothetical protein [Mycobacterium sp.]